MKKTIFPLLVIFILLSVGSCDHPCAKGSLAWGLIGFSDQEVDTIILRRFVKNATPSAMIDTFILDNRYSRSQDTLRMTSGLGISFLESDYDYELYFPLSGKLLRITDIQEEKRDYTPQPFNCKKDLCANQINSYKLNGQTFLTDLNSNTYFSK